MILDLFGLLYLSVMNSSRYNNIGRPRIQLIIRRSKLLLM